MTFHPDAVWQFLQYLSKHHPRWEDVLYRRSSLVVDVASTLRRHANSSSIILRRLCYPSPEDITMNGTFSLFLICQFHPADDPHRTFDVKVSLQVWGVYFRITHLASSGCRIRNSKRGTFKLLAKGLGEKRFSLSDSWANQNVDF